MTPVYSRRTCQNCVGHRRHTPSQQKKNTCSTLSLYMIFFCLIFTVYTSIEVRIAFLQDVNVRSEQNIVGGRERCQFLWGIGNYFKQENSFLTGFTSNDLWFFLRSFHTRGLSVANPCVLPPMTSPVCWEFTQRWWKSKTNANDLILSTAMPFFVLILASANSASC